ncbi:hypothetical protein V8J88_13655 [Massilia sp. W12]|uniref:hypothetical protein n=1 Tax=Massilia sp. W12 TaxID=3126507 RepID=UPI0030CC54E3
MEQQQKQTQSRALNEAQAEPGRAHQAAPQPWTEVRESVEQRMRRELGWGLLSLR